MKNYFNNNPLLLLLIAFFTLITLNSCNNTNITYRYGVEHTIPDSLADEKAQYIKELVSAASFHMTGGEYESPENVIYAAGLTFDKIYGIAVEGLNVYHNNIYKYFIPYSKLDSQQRVIFNNLKYHE